MNCQHQCVYGQSSKCLRVICPSSPRSLTSSNTPALGSCSPRSLHISVNIISFINPARGGTR